MTLPTIDAPAQMCYYRLNIFTHCGHISYSPISLRPSPQASFPPEMQNVDVCTRKAHPFQTLRVEGNCANCERERRERLQRVFGGEKKEDEEGMVEKVRFEAWKWKVKYTAPKREGGDGKLKMDLGREMAGIDGGGAGAGADRDGNGDAKTVSALRKMVRWRWKRDAWRKSDASRLSGSAKSLVNSVKSPK